MNFEPVFAPLFPESVIAVQADLLDVEGKLYDEEDQVIDEIRQTDISKITPLEALNKLDLFKAILKIAT